VLAERSIIGQGCKLESVVMMGADYYDDQSNGEAPGLGVGDGAQIQDAIIDKNARIGKNVFLSPKGMEEGWADSGENVYVRDGIVIVTKNGVVADGVRIGNP
jgi:glucose-1-phosphate adenylyltransferase